MPCIDRPAFSREGAPMGELDDGHTRTLHNFDEKSVGIESPLMKSSSESSAQMLTGVLTLFHSPQNFSLKLVLWGCLVIILCLFRFRGSVRF